ncbi:DUF523 domain-containing protein [Actinomyces sp. B33]|uniref:DUF523 domain-containing protein n=1 Tax=Actinomyces sp. B33 TaxID=2942131 RepID=UPI0023412CBF|nr:DUF523 domain-containing protein [Actinomyces sp. B33]MDC4233949.1 DUF523 domain-containing protein [Actinomyces sp. B33]
MTDGGAGRPGGSPAGPAPVLVSACLAGVACRYDGRAKTDPRVVEEVEAGRALPRCAEVLGGLGIPRPPAEIVGGDGFDVLDGRARVVTADGRDVTEAFVRGARGVADEAAQLGVARAVLQDRSPSCGCTSVYDGTHSGALADGAGVLAAALIRRGIDVEAGPDGPARAGS